MDKLKKIWEIMLMLFFCLQFLKMVGKLIRWGGTGGRFINGEKRVVFTPLQIMKEIGVFWLHCTAWY